ncbi:MAG: hypothetical protein KGJ89_03095 [Patescibacteria group bacterium]|nr:hypothetical protein [Patescibacteria group bacterium]MDE2015463.1 hypothetical protein [Patescibacteria group bacterium]MDE2226921.1 hypothetical protein [Patescibacteria group bacterium]
MPILNTKLTLVIFILFTAMAVFGLTVSMNMDSHGNMASCPLMNGTASICRMNIMEHLSAWGLLSAAVIPNVIPLLLLFTFLFSNVSRKLDRDDHREEKVFLYNKNQIFINRIFNPILFALSRGILHAKIYDYSLNV